MTKVTKALFEKLCLMKVTKVLIYIKKKLIDSDGGMYLTVDFLIEINNIITGSK